MLSPLLLLRIIISVRPLEFTRMMNDHFVSLVWPTKAVPSV